MTGGSVKRRVGVIGTFVSDVIYGCPPNDERTEGIGGVAYVLGGLDAALIDEWEIVPLIKVGTDVLRPVTEFLSTVRHLAPESALLEVEDPNNRSEIRYFTEERRVEVQSGRVPPWRWSELEPLLAAARLDALYVNFLSGWELDLETARRVRTMVAGPKYVDLHMLMWQPDSSGLRRLRSLPDASEWYRCFDLLQVNEDEMSALEPDAASLADAASGAGVVCTVVTRGRLGAEYFSTAGFTRISDLEAAGAHLASAPSRATVRSALIAPELVREGPGIDPTGCGDVWGATYFARLLAGDEIPVAIRVANEAAGRNTEYHGAAGLASRLALGAVIG